MRAILKRLVQRLAPRRARPQRQSSGSPRHDIVCLAVQKHVTLAICWKVMPHGQGPAASLYLHDQEVLRFDCFGWPDGHYHVALRGDRAAKQFRLYFPEPTSEAQIDRTLFELTTNLAYYLQRNPDPRVRKTVVRAENLAAIGEMVKAKMLEYLEKVRSATRVQGVAA